MVSVGIYGLKGGCKTLLMTLLGYYDCIVNKRTILSNYKCTFSNPIDPVQFAEFNQELKNTTILFDEISGVMDSFLTNTRGSRDFTYFYNQSRHFDVSMIFTAQLENEVNSRITKKADYSFIATAKRDLSIKDELKNLVEARLQKIIDKYVIGKPLIIPRKVFEELKIFDMYNTFEVIKPPHLLGNHGLNYQDVINEFNDSPNKKSFVSSIRKDYPFFSISDWESVYSYVKIGKHNKAKKLLGITDKDNIEVRKMPVLDPQPLNVV